MSYLDLVSYHLTSGMHGLVSLVSHLSLPHTKALTAAIGQQVNSNTF